MIYTHIAVGETFRILYTMTPFGSSLAVLIDDGPPICTYTDDTGALTLTLSGAPTA